MKKQCWVWACPSCAGNYGGCDWLRDDERILKKKPSVRRGVFSVQSLTGTVNNQVQLLGQVGPLRHLPREGKVAAVIEAPRCLVPQLRKEKRAAVVIRRPRRLLSFGGRSQCRSSTGTQQSLKLIRPKSCALPDTTPEKKRAAGI